MMSKAARLVVGALACTLAAAGGSQLDEIALVQRSAFQGEVAAETEKEGVLRRTPQGPVAETTLGPMLGVDMGDHVVFKGIPYAEPPLRFQKSVPKTSWAPKTFKATEFGDGCVGSSTEKLESEDCLHLNVWLPKGNHENMPVVVYFHGGLNMHGSGSENLRQGDGITQSKDLPVIFINFDYRLGIFGWIYGEPGENVTANIGLRDQQMALRWVHDNIAAFGGDPKQVALMGQSEGAGNIMFHLISPKSAGLFSRAIFHSPPAEVWNSNANKFRTQAILERLGCKRENMLACLRKLPADKIWGADWSPEDTSRFPFSPTWMKAISKLAQFSLKRHFKKLANYLGWHAVVDGDVVPGEIHELIPQGRWNKVPILLTVSRNESLGVLPGVNGYIVRKALEMVLKNLIRGSDYERVTEAYNASLREIGIEGTQAYSMQHQMLTDKIWTCEAYAFAKEVALGGGSIQLGGFWHKPKFDPVGASTNLACMSGAVCHAAEMLYSVPQSHQGGIPPMMKEEYDFMLSYRDNILTFVHGGQGPWERYALGKEVITFVDEHGARVEEGYRKKQCKVLDSSMSDAMPEFMMRRSSGL